MTLESLADAIDRREEITDEEMDYINRMAYQEKDLLEIFPKATPYHSAMEYRAFTFGALIAIFRATFFAGMAGRLRPLFRKVKPA